MTLNRVDKMLLLGLSKDTLPFMRPYTTARVRLMNAGYCELNGDGYMTIAEKGLEALRCQT